MLIDMFDNKESLDFSGFKNREVKARDLFKIKEVSKPQAMKLISKYHYLKDAKFFSKFSYGLFCGCDMVGVATFSNPQGVSSLKGWFGVGNTNQDYLELSRLCLMPSLNNTNASSYLLSGSIRMLKKEGVKAVITLADSDRHNGAIYQVCNFKYYGLTGKKSDFYSNKGLNPRGKTRDLDGVWLPRSRKHRYCYLIDKSTKVNYKEEARPKKHGVKNTCICDDLVVFDNRFNKTYCCPKCVDFKEYGLMDINELPYYI